MGQSPEGQDVRDVMVDVYDAVTGAETLGHTSSFFTVVRTFVRRLSVFGGVVGEVAEIAERAPSDLERNTVIIAGGLFVLTFYPQLIAAAAGVIYGIGRIISQGREEVRGNLESLPPRRGDSSRNGLV